MCVFCCCTFLNLFSGISFGSLAYLQRTSPQSQPAVNSSSPVSECCTLGTRAGTRLDCKGKQTADYVKPKWNAAIAVCRLGLSFWYGNRFQTFCRVFVAVCLDQITTLVLDSQKISKLYNLNKLVNLRWASFNDNDISKLEGLDNCLKLEELSVNNNNISSFNGKWWRRLVNEGYLRLLDPSQPLWRLSSLFRPVETALLGQTEPRWESADYSGCLSPGSPVQAVLPVCGEQLYQVPARHPEGSLPPGAVPRLQPDLSFTRHLLHEGKWQTTRTAVIRVSFSYLISCTTFYLFNIFWSGTDKPHHSEPWWEPVGGAAGQLSYLCRVPPAHPESPGWHRSGAYLCRHTIPDPSNAAAMWIFGFLFLRSFIPRRRMSVKVQKICLRED